MAVRMTLFEQVARHDISRQDGDETHEGLSEGREQDQEELKHEDRDGAMEFLEPIKEDTEVQTPQAQGAQS